MQIYEKPLIFIQRIKEEYEKTNKKFIDLIPKVMELNSDIKRKQINILDLALYEIFKDKLIEIASEDRDELKLLKHYYYPTKINLSLDITECSLEDILNIHNCLEYSQKDEYLLIHYDEIGVWTNPYINSSYDRWKIYNGFLTECRSCIINLETLTFVTLPFYKFRNLNESEEYQQEKIEERIKKAKVIEWSDKLDGSMIQMRAIYDKRFWEGIIISTSGNINSARTNQLTDVLTYVNEQGKNYAKLAYDFPDYTCLYEWIHGNDPHVVQYDKSQWGLHLIGMRNIKNGHLKTYKEVIELANKYKLPCTTLYSETLESVLAKLKFFKCSEKEGYVLNIDGFLVKVKCDDFVGMIRIIQESASFNTIIRYVVHGTIDDMLAKIPEAYQDRVISKIDKIYAFEKTLSEIAQKFVNEIPKEASRKEAMLYISNEVPKKLRRYVIAMYLGTDLQILAKNKDTQCPSYIKESDIDKMYLYLERLKLVNALNSISINKQAL